MKINIREYLLVLMFGMVLAGCSGVTTFPSYVRAGDTAVVAAGWFHNFSRDNITVTITPDTPTAGYPAVYLPNDPAVRAVVNLYPDPVSSVVVSYETGQDQTFGAWSYGNVIDFLSTGGDKDWWQTTVFVDLPTTLPVGRTTINITNSDVSESVTSYVQVIGSGGRSEEFDAQINGPLNVNQLASLERATHNVVDFSGSTVPYAIQADFSHDPDFDSGGIGRTHIVNTRGDLKSLSWSDTGSSTRVLLMPTKGQVLSRMSDFKVYIAGGITGLVATNLEAFDIDGNVVPGVTVSIDGVTAIIP